MCINCQWWLLVKPDHSETTRTQFLQFVHTEKKRSNFLNHLASVVHLSFSSTLYLT